MKKNYETALPTGYREAMVIDATDKKLGIILNVAALVIAAVVIALTWVIVKPNGFFDDYSSIRQLWLIGGMIIYIVLHELVHGIAYKTLTGRKLTFGLTASVAYCGVPDIFVYRKTALIALLAPFVVFTVIFGGLLFVMQNQWDIIYMSIMLGLHIGGCVGDLYDTYLYLFKFRDPNTLMRDTGPKQTFYINK